MKKQILNLGKALKKAEQKQIIGGRGCPPACGFTGCMQVAEHNCETGGYGAFWHNGNCYACY